MWEFWRLYLLDRLLWRGPPSRSPRFQRRQAVVSRLYREAGFTTPVSPRDLPELDWAELDRATLLQQTEGLSRPLVIRNLPQSPAHAWTRDSLRERLAGTPCTTLKWDQEVRDRDWDIGAKAETLDFACFLDRLEEDLYLNNSTDPCPVLEPDLGLERIRERCCGPGWDEFVCLNFFIGGAHVFSELHGAPGGNFFLNVVGRKRWTLVDPRHAVYLHPVSKPPYNVHRSALQGWRRGDPRLFCVPRYEVVLDPGDMLFNAPWWWHEVENLDAFQVGVSLRHAPPPYRRSATFRNQPLLTLTSFYPAARLLSLGHWLSRTDKPLRSFVHPLHSRVYRDTDRPK